ncbi:MAG TPA: potassium channel family protein [Ornithinibacter sp.]|nr:potassium channel family protein [Ornithinibacter sp.]HQA13379.1 potassium channel family protein [Ornithinibacter sp.]HQD67503.1 potassium channel family protein [Ornithinibacter sp.]
MLSNVALSGWRRLAPGSAAGARTRVRGGGSHPGSRGSSHPDVLRWASTTVTTVGYGDRYPVSTEGRVVAVVLMRVGIGVVGAGTASVASWILGRVEAERAGRDAQPADGAPPDMQ